MITAFSNGVFGFALFLVFHWFVCRFWRTQPFLLKTGFAFCGSILAMLLFEFLQMGKISVLQFGLQWLGFEFLVTTALVVIAVFLMVCAQNSVSLAMMDVLDRTGQLATGAGREGHAPNLTAASVQVRVEAMARGGWLTLRDDGRVALTRRAEILISMANLFKKIFPIVPLKEGALCQRKGN